MKKVMLHIVAGYPTMEDNENLILAMDKAGAGFIEIQIPFSDPVADGSVIMEANKASLEKGTKVEDCFKLMEKMSGQVSAPLLFMTYFNILHRYGVEAFCKRAKEFGCYGLIVPDMPIDEEDHEKYVEICDRYDLKAIQVISPLTPEERLKKIAKFARGFVYCVSKYGTTGNFDGLNPKLAEYLEVVKKYIDVPLAVGFGITNKKEIGMVFEHADIAVVGSAVIREIDSRGMGEIDEILAEMI